MTRMPESIRKERTYDERFRARRLELEPAPTTMLHDLLVSDEEMERAVATALLHRRGERATFERAAELYRHDRPEVRETAALVLGQLGDGRPFKSESLPILENILINDPSPDARSGALYALGHLDAEPAVKCIVAAVDDPSPRVREAAAFALGTLDAPKYIPIFQKLCDDADEDVAEWAALELDYAIWEELKRESTPRLLDLLIDEDEPTRNAAVMELEERAERHVFDRALALCNHDQDAVRVTALDLVGRMGRDIPAFKAAGLPVVEETLRNDPSPGLRIAAMSALKWLRATEALPSLIKNADHPDAKIRMHVAITFWRLQSQDPVPTLEILVKDPDDNVRDWAEFALEELKALP